MVNKPNKNLVENPKQETESDGSADPTLSPLWNIYCRSSEAQAAKQTSSYLVERLSG